MLKNYTVKYESNIFAYYIKNDAWFLSLIIFYGLHGMSCIPLCIPDQSINTCTDALCLMQGNGSTALQDSKL